MRRPISKPFVTNFGYEFNGFRWKASWKPVTSNRFDSKAFQAAGYADLYKQYSKTSTTRRFLCNPVALPV